MVRNRAGEADRWRRRRLGLMAGPEEGRGGG
jgi:hypothetical protein